MTEQTPDEESGIRKTVDAVVAARAASEMNEAIDLGAVAGDDPDGEPVDIDHLGNAIGRPVGRLIANRLVDGTGATGVAKRTVAGRVSRRVTAETVRVVLENVDTEAIAETLVELDQETLPGPSLIEAADTAVESTTEPSN